jgi:hypothetical protein
MNRAISSVLALSGIVLSIGVTQSILSSIGENSGNGDDGSHVVALVAVFAFTFILVQFMTAVALLFSSRHASSVAVALGPPLLATTLQDLAKIASWLHSLFR